ERSSQTGNHGTTPPYGRELPSGRTRKGEVDSDALFRVFRWIPWLISDPPGAAIGCCWTESTVRFVRILVALVITCASATIVLLSRLGLCTGCRSPHDNRRLDRDHRSWWRSLCSGSGPDA